MKALFSFLCLAVFLVFPTISGHAENNIDLDQPIQNLQELNKVILNQFPGLETSWADGRLSGQWRFVAGGREVAVIADQAHNRVRVMTQVGEIDLQDKRLLFHLLEANFGRALDARYALTRNILWTLFLHSLDNCRPSQLREAVRQVVSLADNTGTSFSSSNLVFGES